METLILHTTRGMLNPEELSEARAMHNAFVAEGLQPGIEIARSLGDLSHNLYTPVEGLGKLSAASPGELSIQVITEHVELKQIATRYPRNVQRDRAPHKSKSLPRSCGLPPRQPIPRNPLRRSCRCVRAREGPRGS